MSSGFLRVFVVLFVAVQLCCAALVNERVTRFVDLRTNVVQISSDITVKNAGDSAASVYEVVIPQSAAAHVADVVIALSNQVEAVSQKSVTDKGLKFTVQLQPALAPRASTTIHVYVSLTHSLTPHPAEISQSEQQLLVFTDNLHFYSPYTTEKQTTEVKLFSTKVETYTKVNPVSVAKDTISYGPYSNVKAFSVEPLRVHYVNNYPQMTVTKLEKEIEVSHWGHVSFEEHIDIAHTGAKLKGGFSRLDFQRNPASSPSHFRLLTAHLPASAHSIYYRDIIGNISTSRVRVDTPSEGKARTTLELLPRYVMFGGWKTKFYYGYVSPLGEFLGITRDGRYSLHVPFGTNLLGAVVDKAVVRVILPEGASNIKVSGVEGLAESRHTRQTYLDTAGRPVIELTKQNLVGDNIATLVVEYSFPTTALYFELVLLVGGFFLLFLLFIFSGRFQLSIGEKGKRDAEFKEISQDLSSRLHALNSRIQKLVDSPDGDSKVLRDDLSTLKSDISKHHPELGGRATGVVSSGEALLEAWKKEKTVDKEGRAAARKKRVDALADFASKLKELDNELTSKL
eukprot:c11651_g1_i2.p1 GENE.c11651_g1_i2~~c11651_g1_i2.p1  ORF type:complete len:569 (+),score=190.84 c11651_g1_i2:1462-3168(+)